MTKDVQQTLMTSESVNNVGTRKDWRLNCIIVLSVMLLAALLSNGVLLLHLLGIFDPTVSSSPSTKSSSSSVSVDGKFGNLIFSEEFGSLNLSRWKHELTLGGGGNWEFEYYTNNRSNSYVRDGILYVKPTLTNNTYTAPGFLTSGTIDLWGGNPADVCTSNAFYGCSRTGTPQNALNSVQSARLRTAESFSFKYGKVEIRAQLPKGDWLWPAIWMLPKQNGYGQWPASGEVDIIEARGNDHLTSGGMDIGSNSVGTTLHWGPYYGADQYPLTTETYSLPNGELFSADFHNWTLEWTPEGFNCSVDGNLYLNVHTNSGYWDKGKFDTNFPRSLNPWKGGKTDAPFDQDFFFVIDLAVGGSTGFFPDGSVSTPSVGGTSAYTMPWSSSSASTYLDFWNAVDKWYPTWQPLKNMGESAALKVDYIRVYEYVGGQ